MLKQELKLRQSQRFNLSHQLQQSLQILNLPINELRELIETELENNPILEEVPPPQKDLAAQIPAEAEDYSSLFRDRANLSKKDSIISYKQSLIMKSITLQEWLLRQLRLQITNAKDLAIGEFIIGNINDDGYLRISTDEIARDLKLPVKDIEQVLGIIQRFEPAGVAARNLSECLVIQLRFKQINNNLLESLVTTALDDVAKKRYIKLSKRFGAPLETIRGAIKQLSGLEPKPGRRFKPDEAIPYVIPDVTLKMDGEDDYRIIINNEYLPRININPKYRMLLNQQGTPDNLRQYIKDKIKAAYFVMKSIEQRQETIYKVIECIVKVQNGFFLTGSGLKPLTYQDVAKMIGRHQSTISRVVANKYIDTPLGIFSLKRFFSAGVNSDRDILSTNEIKERIKALIEQEDKNRPLSDKDIVDYFQRRGIKLARRTVTKYRKLARILPSNLRKA